MSLNCAWHEYEKVSTAEMDEKLDMPVYDYVQLEESKEYPLEEILVKVADILGVTRYHLTD